MYIFYFPKMGKTVFDLHNGKLIFSSFSFVFAFKQAKEHILFLVQR